jgi:acetate kinase
MENILFANAVSSSVKFRVFVVDGRGKLARKIKGQCPACAPLHQPHNLAPIRSILTNLPQLAQLACFDTAFHRDHAAVADHFAAARSVARWQKTSNRSAT